MSFYTRRLKREANTYRPSTKKEGEIATSANSSNYIMKRNNERAIIARKNRSLFGSHLAMTNQGTKTTCCAPKNMSRPLIQMSYYNRMRRKTLCVTPKCTGKNGNINIYKRFPENGSSIFIDNKKSKLLKDLDEGKNNCKYDPSKTKCMDMGHKPVITKTLPYMSSSDYLELKKSRRCFPYESPLVKSHSCTHI
jgi:hypothetical protein